MENLWAIVRKEWERLWRGRWFNLGPAANTADLRLDLCTCAFTAGSWNYEQGIPDSAPIESSAVSLGEQYSEAVCERHGTRLSVGSRHFAAICNIQDDLCILHTARLFLSENLNTSATASKYLPRDRPKLLQLSVRHQASRRSIRISIGTPRRSPCNAI